MLLFVALSLLVMDQIEDGAPEARRKGYHFQPHPHLSLYFKLLERRGARLRWFHGINTKVLTLSTKQLRRLVVPTRNKDASSPAIQISAVIIFCDAPDCKFLSGVAAQADFSKACLYCTFWS
jgi:hypothetical protein